MRSRSVPLTRIFRMLVPNGNLRPARPHRAQEGRHQGFSPLANHPFSFRTRFARKSKWRFGIAARPPQRVSKSGLLPRRGAHRAPNTASGETMRISGFHPVGARIARPHSTRPERRLHANDRHKPCIDSTPAPRGQARNETVATLSQIKFFHRMWTNLFAVAGSRGHPPAGVIRKRGRSAPSSRAAASVHASNRRFAAALSES